MLKPLLALPLLIVTLVLLAHFSPISAQTSSNYLYLNGNVGIGTASPGGLMELKNNGGIASGTLRLTNGISGSTYWMGVGDAGCGGAGYFFLGQVGGTGLCGGNLQANLTIGSSGNVGIGTTTPGANLDVAGSTGGNVFVVRNPSDAASYGLVVKPRGTGYTGVELQGTNYNLTGTPNILLESEGGSVGIGTTNPGAKLDVAGNVRSSTYVTANNLGEAYGGAGGMNSNYYHVGITDSWFPYPGNNYNYLRGNTFIGGDTGIIQSNGNVGIGTTAPGALLNVNGAGVFGGVSGPTGSEPLVTVGSGSGIAMNDRNGGSNPRWVIYPAAGVLRFWSNGDLMGIQTNGNVGIGTTSPGAKLEVNGSTAVDGNLEVWNNGWLTVHSGTITAQGKNALVLNGGSDTYGGTYLGFYDTVGDLPGYPNNNYHIIKTDDPYINISLAGVYSAFIDSGGGWHPVSSKTKKENFVQPNFSDILIKIDKLPVTKWNYKFQDPSIKHIGPFAEDFHSAFGLSGTDTQTIDYTDEIGVSLAGVKALSQEVKDLQKQNQDLEKRLDSLEKKVDGL